MGVMMFGVLDELAKILLKSLGIIK